MLRRRLPPGDAAAATPPGGRRERRLGHAGHGFVQRDRGVHGHELECRAAGADRAAQVTRAHLAADFDREVGLDAPVARLGIELGVDGPVAARPCPVAGVMSALMPGGGPAVTEPLTVVSRTSPPVSFSMLASMLPFTVVASTGPLDVFTSMRPFTVVAWTGALTPAICSAPFTVEASTGMLCGSCTWKRTATSFLRTPFRR